MNVWSLFHEVRSLTEEEIQASLLVHPLGMIPYDKIVVIYNSVLSRVSNAFVTTLHSIHLPQKYVPLDVMVHELTHVAQFRKVGLLYMPQALQAQVIHGRKGGVGSRSAYDYTKFGSLEELRQKGVTFKDLNREAQAELIQDYYNLLVKKMIVPQAMLAFVHEMESNGF